MEWQKTVLLVFVHVWLAFWLILAYRVLFRSIPAKNYEWNKRVFGRLIFLSRDAYIRYEKVVMGVAVPFGLFVYVFSLIVLLK